MQFYLQFLKVGSAGQHSPANLEQAREQTTLPRFWQWWPLEAARPGRRDQQVLQKAQAKAIIRWWVLWLEASLRKKSYIRPTYGFIAAVEKLMWNLLKPYKSSANPSRGQLVKCWPRCSSSRWLAHTVPGKRPPKTHQKERRWCTQSTEDQAYHRTRIIVRRIVMYGMKSLKRCWNIGQRDDWERSTRLLKGAIIALTPAEDLFISVCRGAASEWYLKALKLFNKKQCDSRCQIVTTTILRWYADKPWGCAMLVLL